jgi:hypothetical protein
MTEDLRGLNKAALVELATIESLLERIIRSNELHLAVEAEGRINHVKSLVQGHGDLSVRKDQAAAFEALLSLATEANAAKMENCKMVANALPTEKTPKHKEFILSMISYLQK